MTFSDMIHERAINNMDLVRDLTDNVIEALGGVEALLGVVEEAEPTVTATELVFPKGTPSQLFPEGDGVTFRGSDAAKERIKIKIAALGPDDRFKCLVTGPAGGGKTTLAWIIAAEIQKRRMEVGVPPGRFFEILPAQISTKADLDTFMEAILPYDIIFIDEVHILKDNVGAEPLYHTLADTGNPRYPLNQGRGWINVPTTVSWIAATTEPGQLDDTTGGALRRRFKPEIRLDPPGEEALVEILHDQEISMDDSVAKDMAHRSGGLPWQVLEIYYTAREFALYLKKDRIDAEVIQRTFDTMGIDKYGMFPEDRLVLHGLHRSPITMRSGEVRYKMSEPAILAAAGLDKQTYKQQVQPRLIRIGLLTTTGGQCLTPKAVELLSNGSI